MASKGYTLTASEMLNNWILKYDRICIATKRGINGNPHKIWFRRGRSEFDDASPLTHVLFNELKRSVDIAWLGGPMLENLASVTLLEDGNLLIEESNQLVSLDHYYPSYT